MRKTRNNLPQRGPIVWSPISPAVTTEVYDTYWRFAAERQALFFRRIEGRRFPWTVDPILRRYKFTNAYRASDRVSQYLIRHVIYSDRFDSEDMVFRILLFKLFNRIPTWTLLERTLGPLLWETYDYAQYDRVLTGALEAKQRIYSAAYIMPPARALGQARKHQGHLKVLERMMRDELPGRLQDARSMRHAFDLLRSYPSLGDFLAYQFVTDLNYSELTMYSEMEFVVAGPGASDGISKCFSDLGGLNGADVIRLVTDRQEEEFDRRGLEFQSLWGRRLQLIDCQNLFCEVSKYARLAHPHIQGRAGRTRIKQIYRPAQAPIPYWYPPKWGLNDRIQLSSGGTGT